MVDKTQVSRELQYGHAIVTGLSSPLAVRLGQDAQSRDFCPAGESPSSCSKVALRLWALFSGYNAGLAPAFSPVQHWIGLPTA
jgi:hypothetical protein